MITQFPIYGDERAKRVWIDESRIVAVVQRCDAKLPGAPIWFYDLILQGGIVMSVPEPEGADFVVRWRRDHEP